MTDYKKWAHGLKKAGYATNPKYAHLLIKVIEDNGLNKYDKIKNLDELGVDSIKPEEIASNEGVNLNAGSSQDFKPVSVSESQRLIYENQGVKYVLAMKGDNFHTVASEFEIYAWQLRKYNDANKKTIIQAGDFIYLEKKNKKARLKYHIVQHNETLRDICQKNAIRMKVIQKINGMKKNEQLRAGARLKLQ